MDSDFFAIAGLVLVVFFLFAAWYDRQTHLVHKLAANRRLKTLRRITNPREKFRYLRSVHHFTFEEMILTALKRKGHKITRNKAYTGDGGIDGRVCIRGVDYLIQAKRYRNHINPAHVAEFSRICRRHRVKGLFVHTGKTGRQSWVEAQSGGLKIISGTALLKLFSD